MRSYLLLVIGLVLIPGVEVVTAGPVAFEVRQDDGATLGPSPAPTTTAAESTLEPSSEPSLEPSLEPSHVATSQKSAPETTEAADDIPRTTAPFATLSSVLETTTASISVTPTPTSKGETPAIDAGTLSQNALPISPKITPAIGLAGVILLITGAVYTVIGIKNKWVYISLSAAYLTSLAVTVLIVYVMSPPVSNAVQGGFLVATILTGLLFGGLSLLFLDLTEGFGCLLGGFCLAMWFLCLRAGGLIRSTTGRGIFIGCMCVALYSLAFIRYTRAYSLIGTISFAGATATILGVDCFTRAGLKEFWLYLWDLNPNIFPLNTTSYPLTRGIKVELAGTVLLTAFGIISQIKLWKMVQNRRQRSEVTSLEQKQRLQQEEEEVGRRLTHNLDRERARWEAIYGHGSHQESSVDTYNHSSKTSSTLREKDGFSSASVELQTLPETGTAGWKGHRLSSASKRISRVPSVTVTALDEEDEIQRIDANGRPIVSSSDRTLEQSGSFDTTANSTQGSSDVALSGEMRSSIRSSPSSVPPPPAVVPLPFRVPDEDNSSEENDNTSVSVAADSMSESSPRRRWSKRISGGQRLKRFSNASSALDDQEEALIVPHVEDDRASSLAATLDDELDRITLGTFSGPPSPAESTITVKAVAATDDQKRLGARYSNTETPLLFCKLDTGGPAFSELTPEQQTLSGGGQARYLETESTNTCLFASDRKDAPEKPDMPTPSLSGRVDTQTPLAVDTDSADCAQSRSAATTPNSGNKQGIPPIYEKETPNRNKTIRPIDPDVSSPSPRSQLLTRLSQEALPRKLSKVALSYRTNEWAKHLDSAEEPEFDEPVETLRPHSKDEEAELSLTTLPDIPKSGREPPLPTGLQLTEHPVLIEAASKPIALPAVSLSQPLRGSHLLYTAAPVPNRFSRDSSQAISHINRKGLRSSATPLSARALEVPAAARILNTPSPRLSSTLLEVRETLTRNKSSSPSLTPLSTSPLSSSPNLLSTLDQENMTLAQRKQMIHQQQLPSTSQQWEPSSPVLALQPQNFDSHQPRRVSAGVDPARREAMLAGWRESMRQEGHLGQKTAPAELEHSRRAALIDEKRRKEIATQERALKAQHRESMMESMMRSGQMLEAHREAMRRMQAKANRNV